LFIMSTVFHYTCYRFCQLLLVYFFFQAEDGIRDRNVTGVQTCALPISHGNRRVVELLGAEQSQQQTDEQAEPRAGTSSGTQHPQIGRASCRERVWTSVVDVGLTIKRDTNAQRSWSESDRSTRAGQHDSP